jgi:hypothetical protein
MCFGTEGIPSWFERQPKAAVDIALKLGNGLPQLIQNRDGSLIGTIVRRLWLLWGAYSRADGTDNYLSFDTTVLHCVNTSRAVLAAWGGAGGVSISALGDR